VTTPSGWSLDRERLREALADWRAQDPDLVSRRFVNEFLMDLVRDPLDCGGIEDDETGIFSAELGAEGNIVVVYVPDVITRRISVAIVTFA
jgi:hypothetical protein